MAYFQNQIQIDQPPDVVFQFLANLENLPKWDTSLKKVSNLTDGINGIGAIFQQESRNRVDQLRVVDYRPNERSLIYEVLPPAAALSVLISAEAREGGTQLTIGQELFTGAPALIDLFTTWRMKRQSARNLIRLKQVLTS